MTRNDRTGGLAISTMVAMLAMAPASTAGCRSTGEEVVVGQGSEITSHEQLGGSDMPLGQYVLTFDDGPGPRTAELANWLGDRGITATFFINGRNVPGLESALAAVKARGHILGNHTQNHDDMQQQSGDVLFHAVADTDALIAPFQPDGPWLLRAPYGAWDARVSDELNATSMNKYTGSIFWNVGGELTATTAADWACWSNGIGLEDCADRYMNEMQQRGRGIILMHDIHSDSVDMAKLIVDRIGAEHFVPIVSAPQIAASLGGRGGGAVPPPPQPCNEVDFKGRCDGNKLTWCEGGQLKTADCVSKQKVCSWKGDAEGHDCVAAEPCGDVTFFGACDGDFVSWCDETGALRRVSCAAKGQRCTLANHESGFDCAP